MRLTGLVLLAALLPAEALAQAARPASTFAQAERNSVELRHGMTPADVQQLLGKPRRTALRSSGGSANGSLQWTYVWMSAGPTYSSSERSLNIEFAAKSAEQWYVNGWSWSNY